MVLLKTTTIHAWKGRYLQIDISHLFFFFQMSMTDFEAHGFLKILGNIGKRAVLNKVQIGV